MPEYEPLGLSIRVKRLMEIRAKLKELKSQEDSIRETIVDDARVGWLGREHLLPTTTITIPATFWITTEFVSVHDFVDSRFPTWELIASHEDPVFNDTTLVLRKLPEYMPFTYEDDEVKVSKVSVEPTPEIDQESLQAEDPNLYRRLFKPVVVVELDEKALSDAIEEDPKVPSILMRHQFSKRATQQRISASEVKE